MASLFEFIAAHETPHEFVEECLAGDHSNDEYESCWDRFNEVAFWEGLHPDDDYFEIIDKMVEGLVAEFA